MPGRLVWINGQATGGKTWMGDYLSKYHGFQHIDGDEELHYYASATDEGDVELRSILEGFTKYFSDYVFEGKGAGPAENWQPFCARLVDRTKVLRKTSPDADIVVSHAAYPRAVRDFIRARMDEPLTLVALTVSVDDFTTAAVARIAKFREAQNLTDEEAWTMIVQSKYPDVPYTGEDGWSKHFSENPTTITSFEESDDHAAVIPTKERQQVARKVEEALGVVPYSCPVDAEAICQVNYDRFKAYAEERKRRHELRSMN